MKIACLGWGSLIWKPGLLPVSPEWRSDGPLLPVEFARVSDGGELATCLSADAQPLPVLWCLLGTDCLTEASDALRVREGIPAERCDGTGTIVVHGAGEGVLASWARSVQVDAVIWTALPPRSADTEGRIPSREEALQYLLNLTGEEREHAMDYLRRVPAQIDTPYRRYFADALSSSF